MMKTEKIMRTFAKPRSSGYTQYFDFVVRNSVFDKKNRQPHIQKLVEYLQSCIVCGTIMQPQTVSSMPFLSVPHERVDHIYTTMARESGSEGKGISQHSITQEWIFENDPLVIALEVPVYDDECSGFIDILRISECGEFIEIWDFKPKADKEKRAAGQLFTYRYLLARCLNLPITRFRCFWFDWRNCYKLDDI